MEKIWLVKQESNIDGDKYYNVVPCHDLPTAKQVMQDEIDFILKESHHFGGMTKEEREESFEIEERDDYYFIFDPCDDYWEEIMIGEAKVW